MSGALEKTYDLSPWRESRRLAISSFRMRVLTGEDIALAIRFAETMGISGAHGLVMQSISAVDDQPCMLETNPFATWDPRTRSFALMAWDSLHTHAQVGVPAQANGHAALQSVPEALQSQGIQDWYDLTLYRQAMVDQAALAGLPNAEQILSINGFALRELTLEDEVKLAEQMERRIGAPHAYARLTSALVEYELPNGTRMRPETDKKADRFLREPWRGWTWQTCELVQTAYRLLHEPVEDIADFLTSHAGPTSSAAPSDSGQESSSTG